MNVVDLITFRKTHMKFNKKLNLACVSVLSVTLLASCNGNSTTENTATVQNIPVAQQLKTTASAYTATTSTTTSNKSCVVVTTSTPIVPTSNISSSQWWSTANISFNVTNNCTDAVSLTNLDVKVKGISLNGGSNGLSFGSVAQSGQGPWSNVSTTVAGNDVDVIISTPACDGAYCSWAQLPVGQTRVFALNASYSGAINNVTVDSVAISSGNVDPITPTPTATVTTSPTPTATVTTSPTPPVVTTGTLTVNFVTDKSLTQVCAKLDTCPVIVTVLDPSTSKTLYTDTVDLNQQPTFSKSLGTLLAGNYTVAINATGLPNGATYVTSPNSGVIAVSASNTSTATVNFSYTAPAIPTYSLTLRAVNPNETSFKSTIALNAKVLDNTTSQTYTAIVPFGSAVTISNLSESHNYTVVSQGVANAATGDYYSGYYKSNLTISKDTIESLILTKVATNLDTVFTVTGLESNVVAPTLSLAANNSSNVNTQSFTTFYQYEPVSLVNGQTYKFESTLTATINVTTPTNYTLSSINPLVVTSGVTAVSVNYTKQSVTPSKFGKINATYWSAWGNNTSYDLTGGAYNSVVVDMPNIDSSYNVIITAFIVTDNGKYVLSTYNPGSQTASTGYYTADQVKNFVTTTKAQGRKVLVSLGGQYFTLTMRASNSTTDIANFVTQVENIIDTYGFDGLDLDLEGEALAQDIPSLAQAVMQVVNHYRNQGQEFWLTMAPEWVYVTPAMWGCNQYGGGSYASNGYISLTQAIGIDNISYIWPQTYNQGTGNGVCAPSQVKVVPTDGMDKFVAAMAWSLTTESGYTLSTKSQTEKMPMIPASKLVLGIPATLGAAGGGMNYVMTPTQISNSWSIMSSYGISIGGFMNWAADWDATAYSNANYNFTHTAWQTGKAVASTVGLQ